MTGTTVETDTTITYGFKNPMCRQCDIAYSLGRYEADGWLSTRIIIQSSLKRQHRDEFNEPVVMMDVEEKIIREFDEIYANMRRWSGKRWVELQQLHKAEKTRRYAGYETDDYKLTTGVLAGRLGMTIEDKKTQESVSFIGVDEKFKEPFGGHDGTSCGDGGISSTHATAIKMLDWLWQNWDIKLFNFSEEDTSDEG